MDYQDFKAPNLDCVSQAELERWKNIFARLVNYASMKIDAMEYRLEGDIHSAVEAEKFCDRQYSQLPEEIRW